MKPNTANPNRRLRANRAFVARFNHLKGTVIRRLTKQFNQSIPVALIRRAVDEAELTAATTGFPELFFPELAAETVRRISVFAHPQDEVDSTNHHRLVAAA